MTRNTLTAAVATLVVLLTAITASAQDAYINVSMRHSGTDAVGTRLAYEVREKLRASSRYDLADDSTAKLGIYLVTIDDALPSQQEGLSSVAAVTFTAKSTSGNYYLNTLVLTVGTNRVNEQATSVLAQLDYTIEQWRDAYNATKR